MKLKHFIKKGKERKPLTMFLLGCTIAKLKKHFEKQFREGMCWDNYGVGGWEIDHIIPCSSFDLTKKSEQEKCFHYTNLQPLWVEENRIKGANIIEAEV